MPDYSWVRTNDERPVAGSIVLGWWRAGEYGVVEYAGNNRWVNPEDDEDDYARPDYWMLIPPPPQE